MHPEYLPPATETIPVVPAVDSTPLTGAIPVVPAFDAAPPTGAIPVVPEYEEAVLTGAIPVVGPPAPAEPAAPEPPATPPSLAEWQFAPNLRWSVQNIASFLPVKRIPKGERSTTFGERPADIGSIIVAHPYEERVATFDEVMNLTDTDGWMIVHGGEIIAERAFAGYSPEAVHLLMSVSKSLTATTAGLLASEGLLSLDAPVTSYVPELRGSGYDGALVRHLIDMRTGVKFSEDYLDNNAEVRLLEEAIGWAPRTHPDVPDTLLGFLATLTQAGPHGGAFDYKSSETDALGFVIERAAGAHTADVMSERLWQLMGAEFDAHVGIDSVGAGMFDGGVSAAMRDLARFGHLYVNGGFALDGVSVIPESWIADTFDGGADSRAAFAASTEPTLMPGGKYRNGFWFPSESADVMLALGIHGQMIYMNRANGFVGVKLSSWALPQDPEKLFWTVRAFDAASWSLGSGAA